jgi:SynChlorMet cassette radical SAM/SPASM protein ScmF
MASSSERIKSCTGEATPSTCAPWAEQTRPLVNRHGEPVPPLRTFYLYLTAGCNLACRHCWITPRFQAKGGTGGHPDLDLLELGIRQAKTVGLQSCKLTGGEPTLHPQFAELCELLARQQLAFWMETNGVLIGAAEARLLARVGMGFCSVSLDGATAETHDYQRAVAGAFDRALEGIAHLVAVGIRPQAILTLTRDNVHELFDLFPLAARLGCSSVKVNLLEPTGRGQLMTVDQRGFSARELLDLGARVEAASATVGIPLHYSWPPAFWPMERLLRGDVNTCGVHGILGILADGTLAMCGIGRHVQELVYGKLGETDVAELWLHHPQLRELRLLQPSELDGVCGRCIHGKSCFGSCRANTYNATGSLRAPYKLCQDAYDLGLFPPGRLRPESQPTGRSPLEGTHA